jgi:hypothetical protein
VNPAAVREADNRFYSLHPELVDSDTGVRRPLTMDPGDSALRRQWMAIYRQVSADPAFAPVPAVCPVVPCPLAGAPAALPAPTPAPVPAAAQPAPACKVEVGANRLGWAPFCGDYYHLFVLYTDEQGKTYYYRGGPSAGGFSAPSQASGGSSEGS